MQCLRCGREFEGRVALCPACFNQGRISTIEVLQKREEQLRSGRHRQAILSTGASWFRVFAWMIDLSLVGLTARLILTISGFENSLGLLIQTAFTNARSDLPELGLWGLASILITWALLIFIVGFPYFVLYESSRHQATIGKRMFGLIVTDLEDQRLPFVTASLRYLTKGLWLVAIALGMLILPLIESPGLAAQAVGGCFILAFLIWLGTHALMFVSEDAQGFHDVLSGTLVQRDLAVPFSRVIMGLGLALLLPLGTLFLRGENAPGLRIEEQWERFRRRELRAGVETLPYNTRLNPAITDPHPQQQAIEIPSSPQIAATANGRTIEFLQPLAIYDLASGIVEIGFFARTLSDKEIQEFRAAPSLKADELRRPELTITLQFTPGSRECDIKNLQAYAISFARRADGFQFEGVSNLMEFSRFQSWLNSEEILGLSCSLCEPGTKGCKEGSFAGIFRDSDRTGSSRKTYGSYSWDLAFRTSAYSKISR